MADEQHKTVLLSIFATLLAAFLIFIVTIVAGGGISVDLIRGYVVPLFISAFTLTVFWGVLIARSKGMLPFFGPAEGEEPKPAQKS